MQKEIAKISLSPMPNGAHYNFMQSTLERAKANQTILTKLSNEVEDLEEALAKENEYLKLSQKSSLTAGISKSDKDRDTYYIGYKSAVRGLYAIPDEEIQASAQILWEHINCYRIDPRDQLDKQTGMLVNFIEDLEGKYADHVAQLGLTSFVKNMKNANEQVRTLMMQRDTENCTKEIGGTRMKRADTDDAYRFLIKNLR